MSLAQLAQHLQSQGRGNGAYPGTERMRLNWQGNLGIGDATPASMFTVGSGDLFQVNSSGQVAAINGIGKEGNFGVPLVVDTVYRTGQTASIAAFNLTNTAVAGLYEIRYYIECTSTGSGNTTITFDWDNATKSSVSTAVSHSATTNFQQGTISIYHAATSSTSIRLSTTYTTTGTYAVRAWVKRVN